MAAVRIVVVVIAALCAAAPGGAAATAAGRGFGGPTLDLLPANASPGYQRTENLPIALRISPDGTRVAELDWALYSACNFEARADWGHLEDIPLGADGSFSAHADHVVPGSGKTATLDVSGRVGSDRIDGAIRFDDPAGECGAGATWTARPAFVGRSSQGTPAVVQLSADRERIARLLLAWVPHCPGGIGLDPPENLIGLDQRNVARLDRRGRFDGRRRATRLRANAQVTIAAERFAGRATATSVAATFRATAALGSTRCTRPAIRLGLR